MFFLHVKRGERQRLLQIILQGKFEDRGGPGRRRTAWQKNPVRCDSVICCDQSNLDQSERQCPKGITRSRMNNVEQKVGERTNQERISKSIVNY